MKVLTVMLAVVALFLIPIMSAAQDLRPDSSGGLILRISSQEPLVPVNFEGSYFIGDSLSRVVYLKGHSPFELRFKSTFVYGIFHRLAGAPMIRVELSRIRPDGSEGRLVGGWDETVILGTTSTEHGRDFFVQTYSSPL